MSRSLIVRPDAEADIIAAYEWYDEQRIGLGHEFLNELEVSFSRVTERPEMYTEVEGPIRRALVRRFPFGVYFVTTPKSIHVLAVLHTARDPDEIRRRAR